MALERWRMLILEGINHRLRFLRRLLQLIFFYGGLLFYLYTVLGNYMGNMCISNINMICEMVFVSGLYYYSFVKRLSEVVCR